MLCSTTAGHIPLAVHHAVTTASISQLQTYLQETPVKHIPENDDIVEQSAYQKVADRGAEQHPW